MQRNTINHVYTVGRVAEDLGIDEDLVHELTLGFDPEDGVIWVYGVNDDTIVALTNEGVEEIQRLLEEYNCARQSSS